MASRARSIIKDAAGAIAPLAADAVVFGLDPPLRHNANVTHDPAPLEEWFATWKKEGPNTSESQDLEISIGGDVAYAYGLRHMTGTKTMARRLISGFARRRVFAEKMGGGALRTCTIRCPSRWTAAIKRCLI